MLCFSFGTVCAEGRKLWLDNNRQYLCVSLQYVGFIIGDAYTLEVPEELLVSCSMLLRCPKTMQLSTQVYI